MQQRRVRGEIGGSQALVALRMRRLALAAWLLALALLAPLAAWAAPKLAAKAGYTLEPLPAWVNPLAPAEVAAIPVPASPLQVLLLDRQIRLSASGVERHMHFVRRIQEPSGLALGSQWEIEFDPSYQSLVIHSLNVWRGGLRLDRLPGMKLQLLQRETQLERQIYDGRKTASVVLEDVRVGDRVEIAYTLRGSNPVFGPWFVDDDWSVSAKGPVGLSRLRLLAPSARNIQVRADGSHTTVESRVSNGWRETLVQRRQAPIWLPDPGLPEEEQQTDLVQFSEFPGWAEVGQWAQALFAAPTSSASDPMRTLVQQLRRSTPEDSLREVLNFVQAEIRYFGTEIGANSHQPAAPETVLRQRFGDCKDKVALMVALLRAMDIEATPLLVNAAGGPWAARHLPSPLAFNHAILQARIGENIWVLDPTRLHQTGALANRQIRGLGDALPAKAGAGLMALATGQDTLRVQTEDLLRFARLAEDPVLEARLHYHGDFAEGLRGSLAAGRRADVERELLNEYARAYPRLQLLEPMAVQEGLDDNSLTLVLRMALPGYLRLVDDVRLEGDYALFSLIHPLRLAEQRPRTRPLRLATPGLYRQQFKVEFGEPVFDGPAQQERKEGDAFTRLRQNIRLLPQSLLVDAELQVNPQPLPASEWNAHNETLRKLWPWLSNTLRLPTLPPGKGEQLRADLRQLDESVRAGRTSAVTSVQARALAQVKLMDAQLQGDRLPRAARVSLLVNQGVQLDNLGRLDDAAQVLQQALDLQPHSAQTLMPMAVNALMRRDDKAALAHSSEVLTLKPGETEALSLRAKVHYFTGQAQLAREDLLQTLSPTSADAGSFMASYSLIWLYLTERRQGASAAQAADALKPHLAKGDVRAWPYPVLQGLMGQLGEDAVRQQAQAKQDEAAGRLCELYYFRGELALLEGDREKARAWFQKSLDTRVLEFSEYHFASRQLAALKAK